MRLKIVLFLLLLLLSRDASSTLQSLLQVCWARPCITLGLQPFASLEPSSLRVTCTRTSDLRNLCDLLLFEILNKTQSGLPKLPEFNANNTRPERKSERERESARQSARERARESARERESTSERERERRVASAEVRNGVLYVRGGGPRSNRFKQSYWSQDQKVAKTCRKSRGKTPQPPPPLIFLSLLFCSWF